LYEYGRFIAYEWSENISEDSGRALSLRFRKGFTIMRRINKRRSS